MSRRARFFFLLSALALCTVLAHAGAELANNRQTFGPKDALVLMLGTFLAIVTELRPTLFSFGRAGSEITLTITVVLPILMLYGWPLAALISAMAVAATDIQARKAWYKVMFNAANYTTSTWVAGLVFAAATHLPSTPDPHVSTLLGGTLAGVASSLVNTTLVASAISVVAGLPFRHVLLLNAKLVTPVTTAMVALAVIAVFLWSVHPIAVVLLVPALIATKLSYNHYVRLRVEADNFVQSLADLVDLRDPYTANHSQRVAELSRALASRLRLPVDQARALEAIARVHDVGKLAIADAVLLKPEPLTTAEYEEMKRHVEVGVRILEHISLYRDSLEILAQHHERLDGSGYPRGLRGDEIIFPARVLAVADAYDAMTTDRPYRPAKTPEEAVRELYRVAGKEYDLNVVRALEDELIARGVLKGPVVPAALEAARQEAEAEAHAAARTPRVVPLPRVGSGRNPS